MSIHQKTSIVIVGAGPSGIAAAIQLKRYHLNFILFEHDERGSLLKNAGKVGNYLGFPEGKSGEKLLRLFKDQLKHNQITAVTQKVESLNYIEKDKIFSLKTKKKTYYAQYAIIASGTLPKTIDLVQNLSNELKSKIQYEAFPLLQERNKSIAIVGAGDIAFDFALTLSETNHILLLNRHDKIKALPELKKEVFKNKKITYLANTVLENITEGKDSSLQLECTQHRHTLLKEVDYLILAIGRTPRKEFYSNNLIDLEQQLINNGLLHLTGDVKNEINRQTAIATSDGIIAALKIKGQMS